jgi:Rps23 Pro-64 3,4-dihydroxylase Tpa1-like proline 4-hydroxylase
LHYVFEWLTILGRSRLRRITGIDSLIKVNAQATLYRPGAFSQTSRRRGYPEQHRRVAYVLYLTRDWRAVRAVSSVPRRAGRGRRGLMPRFNSLIVPRAAPHVVSYVAPFATQPRYAITGWLCDGPETMEGVCGRLGSSASAKPRPTSGNRSGAHVGMRSNEQA